MLPGGFHFHQFNIVNKLRRLTRNFQWFSFSYLCARKRKNGEGKSNVLLQFYTDISLSEKRMNNLVQNIYWIYLLLFYWSFNDIVYLKSSFQHVWDKSFKEMLKNIHLLKAILRNRAATKHHYSNTEYIPFLSDKYYVKQSYIMCSSETMTFNHL